MKSFTIISNQTLTKPYYMTLLDLSIHLPKIGIALLWCTALQPAVLQLLFKILKKNLPLSVFYSKRALNQYAFLNRVLLIVIISLPPVVAFIKLNDWIIAIPLYFILLQLILFDLRYFWLPDRLTIPLIIIGLLISASNMALLKCSLWGGGLAFIMFQVPRLIFNSIYGHETLGLGDVKLAVTMGVWLGIHYLPFTISLACIAGALGFLFCVKKQKNQKIAFGVFLSLALWLSWSWNIAGSSSGVI